MRKFYARNSAAYKKKNVATFISAVSYQIKINESLLPKLLTICKK